MFIILILLNIFGISFIGLTKVKVIDAVTGRPVGDITVQQGLIGSASQLFAGSNHFDIRFIKKTTDISGTVMFSPMLYIKPSLLRSFSFEYDSVNQLEPNLTHSNENYYSEYIQIPNYISFLPYKYKVIKILPKVENISECNNNQKCITINSKDLDLIEKFKACADTVNLNISSFCKEYFGKKEPLVSTNGAIGECASQFWGNNRVIQACEKLQR